MTFALILFCNYLLILIIKVKKFLGVEDHPIRLRLLSCRLLQSKYVRSRAL